VLLVLLTFYTEGQTSEANAVEVIDTQVSEAPADATGKYTVMIDDPNCRELLESRSNRSRF